MKPKAKYKKFATILPLFHKFHTTKDLAVFLFLFTLFSFYVYFYYLGSLLINAAKSEKGYTDAKGVCESSLLSNLSSLFTEGIGVYRHLLKDSGIFLKVLEQVEEDQLSKSKFHTIYLSGDLGDIGLLYKKVLKIHGFSVQTDLSNEIGSDLNVSERVSTSNNSLWICLGERRQRRRECRPTLKMKANHLTALTKQLGRRENFCNTINILRKCAAAKTKLWTSLPLCFVLPEHLQQFRDVAEALGSSSVIWKLEPTTHAIGKHQHRPQKLPATVLANPRLLEKALSPILSHGKGIVQQALNRPLVVKGQPIFLRIFVLATSLAPLRVYVHRRETIFYGEHNRRDILRTTNQDRARSWTLNRFWSKLMRKSGQAVIDELWTQVKVQIAGAMAVAENEIVSSTLADNATGKPDIPERCSTCSQMLSFDFALSTSLEPVLRNVNLRPSLLPVGNSLDILKSHILPDAIRLLTARNRVAPEVAQALRGAKVNTGLMCHFCQLSHDICLTEEDLRYLLQSRREFLEAGEFLQVYPSPEADNLKELLSSLDEKIQRFVFSTSDTQRGNLYDVSKQHQTAQLHALTCGMEKFYARLNYTNHQQRHERSASIPAGKKSTYESPGRHEGHHKNPPEVVSEEKEIDCVQSEDSLSYLQWLRVSPERALSPQFHPNVTEYTLDVPYDQLTLQVHARALYCHAEARLDHRFGPSKPVNYVLGLGYNRVVIVVVDIRHTEARVANAYALTIFRRTAEEAALDPVIDYAACSLKQSCELKVYPRESCGLLKTATKYSWKHYVQSLEKLDICRSGYANGAWALPCVDCTRPASCLWSEARWTPAHCRYDHLTRKSLKRCLTGTKLLFIGDSTNRGMMYYTLMRLNGTLAEWHKSHGIRLHRRNLNEGRTEAGFAYYPQFWLSTNRWPSLGSTLKQLVNSMSPLENSNRTVLILGGVHWINTKHLNSVTTTLKSLNMEKIKIVVKTYGSGFHQRTDGVHQLTLRELQAMGKANQELIQRARQLNMNVVDTFNMTSARFKDFTQGICACHFHRVVSNSLSTYSIEGPINEAYGEILLSQLCSQQRSRPWS